MDSKNVYAHTAFIKVTEHHSTLHRPLTFTIHSASVQKVALNALKKYHLICSIDRLIYMSFGTNDLHAVFWHRDIFDIFNKAEP